MNSDLPYNNVIRALNKQFVLLIFAILFIVQGFNGVIKYALGALHLIYIYYIPVVLALLYVCVSIILDLVRSRMTVGFFSVIIMLLISTFVGMYYVKSIPQVLFGNYLLIMFLFGFRVSQIFLNNINTFVKLFKILSLIMIVGVFFNLFVDYPWEGFNYSVGNMDMLSSRTWSTYGIKRLGGFGASSSHTAATLLVYVIFLFIYEKNKFLLFVYWLLVFSTLLLTTSKGAILAFVIFTVSKIFWNLKWESLNKLLIYLNILIGVALPASVLFKDYESISGGGIIGLLLFSSFGMRLTDAWPDVFSLLTEHGDFFWGRGQGGMGIAQTYFEPVLFCPGDNLWLYFYSLFGAWGLLIILSFYLSKLRKLDINKSNLPFLMFSFFLIMFNYGITFVTFQLTVFLLFSGVFTSYFFNTNDNTEVC